MTSNDRRWAPPENSPAALDGLNWGADCGLFSRFVVETLRSDLNDGAIRPLVNYLRSVLSAEEARQPTDFQLLQWHETLDISRKDSSGVHFDAKFLSRVKASNSLCVPEACNAAVAALDTDSDLAGPGVYATYSIEAMLVTVFIVVLFIAGCLRSRAGRKPQRAPQFLDAFRGTIPEITYTVVFLCFGVQVTALLEVYNISVAQGAGEAAGTLYLDLVTLASCMAYSPMFVILPIFIKGLRRRWLKRGIFLGMHALWLGVIISSSAVNSSGRIFGLPWNSKSLGQHTIQEAWSSFQHGNCEKTMGQESGLYSATWLLTQIMLWAPLLYVVGLICTFGEEALQLSERLAMYILSALGLVSMWVFLGALTLIRRGITRGPAWVNPHVRHWSFGQIFAVIVWIPVIVEMGYITIYGMRLSYQSRISDEFKVMPAVEPGPLETEDEESSYGWVKRELGSFISHEQGSKEEQIVQIVEVDADEHYEPGQEQDHHTKIQKGGYQDISRQRSPDEHKERLGRWEREQLLDREDSPETWTSVPLHNR